MCTFANYANGFPEGLQKNTETPRDFSPFPKKLAQSKSLIATQAGAVMHQERIVLACPLTSQVNDTTVGLNACPVSSSGKGTLCF